MEKYKSGLEYVFSSDKTSRCSDAVDIMELEHRNSGQREIQDLNADSMTLRASFWFEIQ